MAIRVMIEPVQFLRIARGLNDIELGATMRALVESALDNDKPKNILEASYFGRKTNGFYHLTATDCVSAAQCNFAYSINLEEKVSSQAFKEGAHV